jgi:hypothetical protein
MITTKIRTHAIVLWDGTKFQITRWQYEFYKQEVQLKKHNEFITIEDIDTREIVFEGRCSEIKRFQEKNNNASTEDIRLVCWYGNKHAIQEECKCYDKFKCWAWRFKKWAKVNYPNVFYDSDLTTEMQDAFIEHYKTSSLFAIKT